MSNGLDHPHSLSDRLPPHNLRAEQGVLGSVVLKCDVLHDVAEILKPEDFYRDIHIEMFRCMLDMQSRRLKIDAITLPEELIKLGIYARLGGDDFLTEIVNAVPHPLDAKYYADIVRDKSLARMLIGGANAILKDCYSNKFTAEELAGRAERSVMDVTDIHAVIETVEMSESVSAAMDAIQRRSEGEVTGIPSGLVDLDDITTGFQPCDLIYIAARPSQGKTALMMGMVDHIATNFGLRVLVASLEMGHVSLGERLLISRSRVDGHKVRTGHGLGTREKASLGMAYDQLHPSPVTIDAAAIQTTRHISAAARRVKLRAGRIDLIAIDYIQLIEPEDRRASRRDQVGRISRDLKAIAKQFNVPVIVLSQVSRAAEERQGSRPRMSDLKESGDQEQDADVVLLVHRPEQYDPNDQPGVAEIIVAKNRNGPTGMIRAAFVKNLMRFESMSRSGEAPFDAGQD